MSNLIEIINKSTFKGINEDKIKSLDVHGVLYDQKHEMVLLKSGENYSIEPLYKSEIDEAYFIYKNKLLKDGINSNKWNGMSHVERIVELEVSYGAFGLFNYDYNKNINKLIEYLNHYPKNVILLD
jgi:hypothetical protein